MTWRPTSRTLFVLTFSLCPSPLLAQSGPTAAHKASTAFPATTAHRRIVLPIERSPRFGAILVSVRVNGKPAQLILDTGSNTTILSPEICGVNLARLPHARPPQKGTGFVGDGRWGQATLVIGAAVWKNRRVLVIDTSDLSRAAQQKVDGILGEDILDDFKFVQINLEDKSLILGSD